MKIISLFNNKGGVGKSTLGFHLANIFAEMGLKTLVIDLDPQCNLSLCGIEEEKLHQIWQEEDLYIDDYETQFKTQSKENFENLLKSPRTIHFLLKPTEEGQGELPSLPPPVNVRSNLDLIPGRLTVHQFEGKIAERWSGAYLGDSLSLRTITNIRTIAEKYSKAHEYDYILIDTSPSLGALNKVIISTVDGFVIPALPDMFSLYGIRNIGGALSQWKKEFNTIYGLISEGKRKRFPEKFVSFLGYTIYNAKKYTGVTPYDLAKAQYNFAQQIPETIEKFISPEVREHLPITLANLPIGGKSVMHSHNTLPNMAQKYKHPIWEIPDLENLEPEDISTIKGNSNTHYKPTKEAYRQFANSLIERINTL